MAELSPAAQAVLDAAEEALSDFENYGPRYTAAGIAAALRAAADLVVPLQTKTPWGSAVEPSIEALRIHSALYSIAAELDS